MGAGCTRNDPNMLKLISLKKNYSIYNRDIEVEEYRKSNKSKNLKSIYKSLEIKLWDHYKIFLKYKNEIERTNNDLYQKLFIKDLTSFNFEAKNIQGDDELKFLFFFNKREFHSVTLSNCSFTFPRVKNYFKYLNLV
jgi:hypothetical protein